MTVKTFMAKPNQIKKSWYLIDAGGIPLGRVATRAAAILRGKHKPEFTPHVDTGDFVVIINAEKVALTGKKLKQKFYYRHSGYPGGIKKVSYQDLLRDKPERAVYLAVKGMLPGSRLGRAMLKKLKIYRGGKHPHEAQKPQIWSFDQEQGKEG